MTNADALKAVLKALQKNCYDDMADEESKPEEKMAEAVEDVGNDEDDMAESSEYEDMEEKDKMAGEEDAEEEDPIRSALKDFMKTKAGPAPRPGTAVMISMEKSPMGKKKSIKDLMNG